MTLDESQRPWFDRMMVSIVSSKVGAPFFRRVMHRIDRPLLRLTRGRFSFARNYPVLLLTTKGAKSGRPRTVPLLYVEHESGLAIIGSRFGSTRHPGWYHNLRVDPHAMVEINGERRECVARPADENERAAIWPQAVKMYSGYEKYAQRAGRRIPIMILSVARSARE